MPSAFLYLGIMLAVIVVWFMLLKRPVYESSSHQLCCSAGSYKQMELSRRLYRQGTFNIAPLFNDGVRCNVGYSYKN